LQLTADERQGAYTQMRRSVLRGLESEDALHRKRRSVLKTSRKWKT
jgi:hypothetical protein